MAKISIKSLNGSVLEGEHDQWKEEILMWEPSELDLLVERYDPRKGQENIMAARMGLNGVPVAEPVFAPEESFQSFEPTVVYDEGGTEAPARTGMVSRVSTPIPQFRRHGDPIPVQAGQEESSEPAITITTAMEPSRRNYRPQFHRHGEPAPVQAPVPPPVLRLREEVQIRTPLNFGPRKAAIDPRDAEIQRRKEAQDNFNRKVQESRQHAADVLAKLGNAK